ncbi:hypothetical protein E6H34_00050 [Candidatus Bathyarchaeota archaeon]|nr:MAG: hypothetical protein E6H34_00050 [Candidatus Bathyarchaeota archaeon]
MSKGRRKRRGQRDTESSSPYTKGEVNVLIDGVLHPLKKTHWVFVLVDEAFHIINEGDIEQSLVKFAQYSLPELVKIFLKKRKP